MSMMHLAATERKRLESQLETSGDPRLYRRTLAVLETARGRSVRQIAGSLHASPRSIWRWLESYRRQRTPGVLADRAGRGRKALWDRDEREALEELMANSPQEWGYAATQWTVPLLEEHLSRCGLPACSPTTLRRRLHELDWVWKRPRYVLEPDPDAEKKTAHPKQAHASAAAKQRAL